MTTESKKIFQVGELILVYVDGRHDFIRFATIVSHVPGDDVATVRYAQEYGGGTETIPVRWLS